MNRGGDVDNCSNHRPAGVISISALPLERILSDKIAGHLWVKSLMPKKHDFWHKRSCLINFLSILDSLTGRMGRKERVEVCFPDWRKVFESVNHRLFDHEVKFVGMNAMVTAQIPNGRCFGLGIEGCPSDRGLLQSGMPQGSALGPMCFLIHNKWYHQWVGVSVFYICRRHQTVKNNKRWSNPEGFG